MCRVPQLTTSTIRATPLPPHPRAPPPKSTCRRRSLRRRRQRCRCSQRAQNKTSGKGRWLHPHARALSCTQCLRPLPHATPINPDIGREGSWAGPCQGGARGLGRGWSTLIGHMRCKTGASLKTGGTRQGTRQVGPGRWDQAGGTRQGTRQGTS